MAAFKTGFLVACMLLVPQPSAAESVPLRLYLITTEIAMPHLEENLRYATTREIRCLGDQALSSAFSILRDDALKGCKLDHESRHDETVSYVLSCDGGRETTGAARWQIGADQIRGTLEVKLGGKNMTFYQRITARPLGECAPPFAFP